MRETDYHDVPPPSGNFCYVRHDRKNPTKAFVLGEEIYYFGEDLIDGGRKIEDLPESAEFWWPIPSPPDAVE